MDRKIKTADGTETFFNEEFKEAYHSTKAGAYTESLYKFVIPCKIPYLAEKGKIRILDVGFGLGYNVAVAITEAKRKNKNVKINIISVEKDRDVIKKIKQLSVPKELKEAYRLILSGEFREQSSFVENFGCYTAKDENVHLEVVLGEGRNILKALSEKNIKFDAVFYDAFSPKVNTEMWSLDLFKVVKNLMDDRAILATYSASLAVRKGFLEAGFKIGLIEPVGRRSYSTVATVSGEIPPLTEKEMYRLENSPYAIPYRDPDLSMNRQEIKRVWEEEFLKRKQLSEK